MKLKLIPAKEVFFNENEHRYTVDGLEAISVTTILTEVGIAEDFTKLPPAVMQRVELARQRGNAYDALAEDAVNAPYDLTEWQKRFLKELENHVDADEFRTQKRLAMHVADEEGNILLTVAGSPDFLGFKDNQLVNTTDLKATYQINEISVTWQTNMYSLMNLVLENKIKDHEYTKNYVLHYQEDQDIFTTKELQTIPVNIIMLMLESFINGETFIEGKQLTKYIDMEKYQELENQLSEIESEIALFIDERQETIDKLKTEMKQIEDQVEYLVNNAGLRKIEVSGFEFTLTRPTTRQNVTYKNIYEKYEDVIFDELMPRLKEEEKERIQKYLQEVVNENIKISNVRGSFKVKKLLPNEETEI